MEFFEVINARRSTRSFSAQPLEPGQLQCILETINQAPSAGNLQAYEVFAVSDRSTRQELASAAFGQEYIVQAPVALVFCAHPARSSPKYGLRGESLYCLQDATIACTYAHLAATALGLASLWIGAFDEDGVRGAIGAGADLRPVAILPIGYSDVRPVAKPRRPLDELVYTID